MRSVYAPQSNVSTEPAIMGSIAALDDEGELCAAAVWCVMTSTQRVAETKRSAGYYSAFASTTKTKSRVFGKPKRGSSSGNGASRPVSA
jgi:hypothetical protein